MSYILDSRLKDQFRLSRAELELERANRVCPFLVGRNLRSLELLLKVPCSCFVWPVAGLFRKASDVLLRLIVALPEAENSSSGSIV